ncbi:hypothetical protein BH24ACT5_BH24ACT5_30550 [soil metagenome]
MSSRTALMTFAEWFGDLDESVQDPIIAVVEMLAEQGPRLDRPHADRIKGSKHHNMKELRPRDAAKRCRVLFIFDLRRQAILLIGGDKSGQWAKRYETAIPAAEKLYDEDLNELAASGLLDDD